MPVTVRSFAKINLGLYIGAPRSDGFHELRTVYQTIALHDRIRVSIDRGSGRGSQIEIRCADPRVPRDESNTCFRIVEKAMQTLRAKGRIVIEIEKRLPVQGGLGGASANAVATLLALEHALHKPLPMVEKLRIAAEIGSDLPLFLVGGTILGVGHGEQVYPLADFPAVSCVVVTPEVGVSTPKAFAEWDRLQGLKPDSSESLDAALKRRSSTNPSFIHPSTKLTTTTRSDRITELGHGLSAWLGEAVGQTSSAPSMNRRGRRENPLLELVRAGIKNDFEEVVFPEYPELREGKRALERAGSKYASLSGSGSTLYGLFASRAAAIAAVSRLQKQGWTAQATSTLTRRQYWSRIFDC
jgi:4-diphosphocytidyl-2-C-methyl-D-erythritol kinase